MKTAKSLEKLLASFGANGLQTGKHLLEVRKEEQQRPSFLTHIDALDQLNGGFRRGSLVEIVGEGSSGKFSLELGVLAAATNAGESTALVDLGDHFDPKIADEMGVQLDRVFWLRPTKFADALKSTEIVLSAGFRFVLLDLGIKPINSPQTTEAVWMRFARTAKTHSSIVVVISPTMIGSSFADMTIQTKNLGSSWIAPDSGRCVLEGLSVGLSVSGAQVPMRLAS